MIELRPDLVRHMLEQRWQAKGVADPYAKTGWRLEQKYSHVWVVPMERQRPKPDVGPVDGRYIPAALRLYRYMIERQAHGEIVRRPVGTMPSQATAMPGAPTGGPPLLRPPAEAGRCQHVSM